MRKIVYTLDETGDHLYVVHPVKGGDEDAADEIIEQRALGLVPEQAKNITFVNSLPDRTFRNAWRMMDGEIFIDERVSL